MFHLCKLSICAEQIEVICIRILVDRRKLPFFENAEQIEDGLLGNLLQLGCHGCPLLMTGTRKRP